MRIALILAAAALAVPTLALAEETPKPAEPKKICRTMPPPTGSHRPGKKLCRTAAEWKAFDNGDVDFEQSTSGSPVQTRPEG